MHMTAGPRTLDYYSFWGQDRLGMLEAAITSGRPAIDYRDP
jgi:hypothetical protein